MVAIDRRSLLQRIRGCLGDKTRGEKYCHLARMTAVLSSDRNMAPTLRSVAALRRTDHIRDIAFCL